MNERAREDYSVEIAVITSRPQRNNNLQKRLPIMGRNTRQYKTLAGRHQVYTSAQKCRKSQSTTPMPFEWRHMALSPVQNPAL